MMWSKKYWKDFIERVFFTLVYCGTSYAIAAMTVPEEYRVLFLMVGIPVLNVIKNLSSAYVGDPDSASADPEP